MGKKETKAARAQRVKDILARLDTEYGTDYRCYLNHETPWQLLIAVILSAQCTDARVNIVTEKLFKKYDTLEKFAGADLAELEKDIHSTGFYHSKAKNIISCCKDLVEKHHGEVPRELDELTALAGVGRKTANVIRGNIYNEPSIVVDTHVKRISKKLGLTENEDPEKVEYDLMKVLPKDHWILWNIHIITLGRTICTARSPKCEECFLRECCPAANGNSVEAAEAKPSEAPSPKAKRPAANGNSAKAAESKPSEAPSPQARRSATSGEARPTPSGDIKAANGNSAKAASSKTRPAPSPATPTRKAGTRP